MIDLHILHLESRPRSWFNRAAESAAHPLIKRHFVSSKAVGNLNVERAKAYRLGQHPYVALLDDDDWLLDADFTDAVEYLEQHPCCAGVYYDDMQVSETGEYVARDYVTISGQWTPVWQLCGGAAPHHIMIHRREALESVLDELAYFRSYDLLLANTLPLKWWLDRLEPECLPLHHIEEIRYAWAQHDQGHHHYRYTGQTATFDELPQIKKQLHPLLVQTHLRALERGLYQ